MRQPYVADRGMVTAEFAVAVLAALSLLLMLLAGVQLAVTQVRCLDTAAEVARQAARGDDAGIAAARREAPPGAQVDVWRSSELVRVEVTVQARPLANVFPPVPLRARAEVVPEPVSR